MKEIDCKKCNKSTPPGSRFCQHCGSKLAQGEFFVFSISPSKLVIIILGILICGTAALAAPSADAFLKANQKISKAKASEKLGNYQSALDGLNTISVPSFFHSKQKEISAEQAMDRRFASYQDQYKLALQAETEGKWQDAQAALRDINTDYPDYISVKTEMDKVQDNIEQDLKKQADAAKQAQQEITTKAKKQAEQAAAAAARLEADKAAAEAQAQAAAQQQAQAEAQAAAAAEATRQAQANADALRNASTAAYWDKWKRATTALSDGHGYFAKAGTYITNKDFQSAMAYLIYSLDSYQSAQNILGTDSIPENAHAHSYLLAALRDYVLMENSEFNALNDLSTDELTQAFTYQREGDNYIGLSNAAMGKY